jgi:hypothetical protein
MSTLVPLRAFNRSQKFDIGAKSVSPSSTVYVNVDSPRVQRDLARHAAIGALLQVGPSFFQADDGYVTGGGKVSSRATTLVLDVSPVAWVNAAKVAGVQSTAGTATLGAADATNPRIDVVVVDTTTGAFSVIAGTATLRSVPRRIPLRPRPGAPRSERLDVSSFAGAFRRAARGQQDCACVRKHLLVPSV